MNAHANKGFASRVGYALGMLVRFCLHDRRPVVRWVKRTCLVVVLFVIFAQNFTWLASAFMTLMSFGLFGLLLVKGGSNHSNSGITRENNNFLGSRGYRDGDFGYGYYVDGVRVDSLLKMKSLTIAGRPTRVYQLNAVMLWLYSAVAYALNPSFSKLTSFFACLFDRPCATS